MSKQAGDPDAPKENRGTAPIEIDTDLVDPGTNLHIRWIVRGDSPYFAPRDLIGKRIAAQAEGSEQYKLSRVTAARDGIDLKRDVEVIFQRRRIWRCSSAATWKACC